MTCDRCQVTLDYILHFFDLNCIGATTRTRQKIQCLPYAGFFQITLKVSEFVPVSVTGPPQKHLG